MCIEHEHRDSFRFSTSTASRSRRADGIISTASSPALAARGVNVSAMSSRRPPPEKTVSLDDLIFEERVKRELHPLDAYPQLLENAVGEQSAGQGGHLSASNGTACFS